MELSASFPRFDCVRHAFADFLFSSLSSLVQFVKCVDSSQYLNSAHGVQHVSVMTRGRTETTTIVLTGEYEVDGFVARKSIGMTEEMQCSQAPIDAVESQVLRQPVFEFIFALSADELRQPVLEASMRFLLCPSFVCI